MIYGAVVLNRDVGIAKKERGSIFFLDHEEQGLLSRRRRPLLYILLGFRDSLDFIADSQYLAQKLCTQILGDFALQVHAPHPRASAGHNPSWRRLDCISGWQQLSESVHKFPHPSTLRPQMQDPQCP